MFASHVSDKGLIPRVYAELLHSIIRKPNYKLAKDWVESLYRRHTNGKLALEKVFNIISHLGNANKSHNEMLLHTSKMVPIKKTMPHIGKDFEKLKLSYILLGNIKL